MRSLPPIVMLLVVLALGASARGEEWFLGETEYVLTEEDSPLILTSLSIGNNGIMRLEPGAHLVIAPSGYGGGIEIEGGRLIAEGTPEKPARIETGSVTNESSIWLHTHHEERRALSLEHTIWDMGPSRLVAHSGTTELTSDPIISIRNSVLTSTASPNYYEDAMLVVYGEGEPLLFEDSLFASGTNAALRLIDSKRQVEIRRCVFATGSYAKPFSAIYVGNFPSPFSTGIGTEFLVEDCRFSGFESAFRVGQFTAQWDVPLVITISTSDFSACGKLIRAESTGDLMEIHMEDSHVAPIHFEQNGGPVAQLVFLRCYIAEGQAFSNVPAITTANDPLDHSPFRSADINNDGIVNHNDLRILMDVIAGHLDPEELDEPGMLDIDGDGVVGLRDLAVLRAFAQGTLGFLPVEESP